MLRMPDLSSTAPGACVCLLPAVPVRPLCSSQLSFHIRREQPPLRDWSPLSTEHTREKRALPLPNSSTFDIIAACLRCVALLKPRIVGAWSNSPHRGTPLSVNLFLTPAMIGSSLEVEHPQIHGGCALPISGAHRSNPRHGFARPFPPWNRPCVATIVLRACRRNVPACGS